MSGGRGDGARVAVIGAGIAGLAAGLVLQRAGCQVRVLEAGCRAGGVVGTSRVGPWAFETGPNSFLPSARALRRLAALAGAEGRIVDSDPAGGRRYVYREGRLHALPSGPGGLFTNHLLTFRGRLRLLAEPFVRDRPPAEPESLAGWIGRRFGHEVVERLADPFVSGVYGGDVAKLGAADAFPALVAAAAEAGSVVKGAIRLARARRAEEAPSARRHGARLHSFAGGLGDLPDAAATALGSGLRLGARVVGLHPDGARVRVVWDGPDGAEEPFDAAVLAVPPEAAASLLRRLVPEAAELVARVDVVPIRVAGLGFARADVGHPCQGFGALIPRSEGTRLLGVLWPSSCFPGRAPDDGVAMTCFVGGAHDRGVLDRPRDEDRGRILDELARIAGVRGEPRGEQYAEWPRAIPQYNLGHRARMAEVVHRVRALRRVALAGNWVSGVSMEDAAASGEAAAGEVLAWLGRDARRVSGP